MCDDKRMSYEETLDATKEELFEAGDTEFKDAKELIFGDFEEQPEDDAALDEMDFDEIFGDDDVNEEK